MTLVTFLFTCSWTELILLLMRTWKDCCSHLRRTWPGWTLPRALQGRKNPKIKTLLIRRKKGKKASVWREGNQTAF
ncbi:hypothetical protein U0070_003814 [Myodes glareolus]|uniref:Secreted protein n=1 Tax=Myodes glareolus TaxID=447135 RepID=A0AAW0H6L9_MYOGA